MDKKNEKKALQEIKKFESLLLKRPTLSTKEVFENTINTFVEGCKKAVIGAGATLSLLPVVIAIVYLSPESTRNVIWLSYLGLCIFIFFYALLYTFFCGKAFYKHESDKESTLFHFLNARKTYRFFKHELKLYKGNLVGENPLKLEFKGYLTSIDDKALLSAYRAYKEYRYGANLTKEFMFLSIRDEMQKRLDIDDNVFEKYHIEKENRKIKVEKVIMND